MKTIPFFIACLFVVFVIGQSNAQLTTTASSDATLLANTLVGAGISVSNATLVCPTGASGTFSNGGSTNIGLNDGVLLGSGLISDAIGPNDAPGTSTNFGAAGDADLTALSGFPTNDACKLEFDFEAVANQISISYVFSSEEYLEWVNTQYNDVFGFLVTGPNPAGGSYTNQNIATIPVDVPVTINSINDVVNSSFYVNNPEGGGTTIEYDGFTVVLTATLEIVPCETYHFKLAIADAGDFILDSGVFLEEASFEASLQCQDITLELDGDGTGSISAEELVASDLDACSFTFSVSQSEFVCSDEGENTVTVTADDGTTILTCEATVTVVVPEGIISIDYGADCRQVYFGYGPASCTDITALASGGHGPYTWEWSTGETTETITVCPETTTDYYVTVTDSNGCVGVAGPIQVLVVDVHCGASGTKVLLCHIPPGNPGNAQTICISATAVPAHLAHGDFLGDCSLTADPCAEEEAPFQGKPVVSGIDAADLKPVIWPNPGNGDLNLHVDGSTGGPVTVVLMTPQGSQVRTMTIESGFNYGTLSGLNELQEGLYYVLVRQADGQEWMMKWVKNE